MTRAVDAQVFRRHHRQESNLAQLGWALIVFALGYGLVLWIVWVTTVVSYEFARLRQFWSTPGWMGLSNFELASLVGVLFTLVALLSAAAAWRSAETPRWALLATHGATLGVVVAWGVNFHGLATIPLNDEWYFEAIRDEPYDAHRVYLGQVVSDEPCQDCPAGTATLSVSLETNATVDVVASPSEYPVGAIVTVRELEGRYTRALRHELEAPVGTDDAELFKHLWFRAHRE